MTASEALEHLLTRTVGNAERVFDDESWMASVEWRAAGLRDRMAALLAADHAPEPADELRVLLEAFDLDAEVRKAGG